MKIFALIITGFVLACPVYGQLKADRMMKIVTRDTSPDVPPGSFAAKPKTLYRMGDKYGRLEEMPDPDQKLQELIISAEPKMWMINLWDKTGRRLIDPGPTFGFHCPIISPQADGQKPPFDDFEKGLEYDFLSAHKAQASQEMVDGKEYDKLTLSGEGYTITLLSYKGEKKPFRLIITKGKLVHQEDYDEYANDLPPQPGLFTLPKDVKIEEPDEDQWFKKFYQNPDDEPFDAYWKKIVEKNHLEDQEVSVITGFTSQVLHRYPELIKGRLDAPEKFPEKQRNVVFAILRLSDTKEGREILAQNNQATLAAIPPPPVATWKISDAGDLDYCWGYYFATGDKEALAPIVSTLDWGEFAGAADKYKTSQKTAKDSAGALKDIFFQTAMWSLGSNGKEDAGVLDAMEKTFFDPKTPKPRNMWIGLLLSKLKPEKFKMEQTRNPAGGSTMKITVQPDAGTEGK